MSALTGAASATRGRHSVKQWSTMQEMGMRSRVGAVVGVASVLLAVLGAIAASAEYGNNGKVVQAPGPDHCHIRLESPYTVLKPPRVVASAQLSCREEAVIDELRVVLYKLDRKHHRWHVVARSKRSTRGTVLNLLAYKRCKDTPSPSYFEVGARGRVNGKSPWGTGGRARITKNKLIC